MAEDSTVRDLRVHEKPEADYGASRSRRSTLFVVGCALVALLSACGLLSRTDQAVTLVEQGELPEGLIAGDVQATALESLAGGLPPNTETHTHLFSRAGIVRGGVTAFVIPTNASSDAAYRAVVGALGPRAQLLTALGEQAVAVEPTGGYPAMIAFVRCGVAVVIRIDIQAMQPALDYAQRLDRRLTTVVCG